MTCEFSPVTVFKTNLKSFPEVGFSFNGVVSGQTKKEARLDISVANTSEKLGFLHSVLLEIDNKYYLLAGPSGIGKSTYSDHLNTGFKTSVFAKDWVAVEKEGDNFYASDLNFAESLKNNDRCLLSGIIFLTFEDQYERDAFVPNKEEFDNLLRETFDTATEAELKRLSLFWTKSESELPFLCAIPARRGSENTISKTLGNLLKRKENSTKPVEVGVIGMGSIGTELAFQLGQVPYVTKVHLHGRTQNKAVGYAEDMNHALVKGKHNVFVAHKDAYEIFDSSSSIFLAFRNESDNTVGAEMPERWQKLPGNLKILNEYKQTIDQSNFSGTFFMITNPVDVLTYALYQMSQEGANKLRTYQTYGIGLELDVMRALHYGKQINPSLEYDDIRSYGNHSDTFALETTLSKSENTALLDSVANASKVIRKNVPRTVFGPIGAALKTYRTFQEGGSIHATTILGESHIGRKILFKNQLPMLAENFLDENYKAIIKNNKYLISRYILKQK